MRAYILSIGDELVSGLTTDTNSGWLAAHLTQLGIAVAEHITVGDHLTPIISAIKHALDALDGPAGDSANGLLLITGGLGPTEDDVTRQALASALSEQLVEDPDAVLQLENWFKARHRIMSPSNRIQALRPSSATCIDNTTGTAPGLRARSGETDIFVMPGVPREMKEMFSRSILPELQKHAGENATVLRKINTFGLGESLIGERIRDLMVRDANPAVGTTVHDGVVSIRVYAHGARQHAAELAEKTLSALRTRLHPFVFSDEDVPLEFVVVDLLRQNKYTLATAESCTGGLLAKLLTDIPGSSACFFRGWVTYSNQAKHEDLSVPESLLEEFGAVSEPVVRAMAEGARKSADSDFALAITGIAGPDGGTAEKPVGTVWIALAAPDPGHPADPAGGATAPVPGTLARRFTFPGNREMVRLRAAQMALALLRWKLLAIEPPV